jgi:hypothetical protein
MELQDETKSISTSKDLDNVILRGLSDSTATSSRPPSDSAAPSVCPPSKDTALVSIKGGIRGPFAGQHILNQKRTSVNRSKQLSKPSWNQF